MIMHQQMIESFLNFPRPDFIREFTTFDGIWKCVLLKKESEVDYVISDIRDRIVNPETDKNWKDIVVPFCMESKLSNLEYNLKGAYLLYYKKVSTENIINEKGLNYLLLNIGAISQEAKIFLNGKFVAESVVSYVPIKIPVDLKTLESTFLEIIICARNDCSSSSLRGSQSNKSAFGKHSVITGIWQSVWAEITGKYYLDSFKHNYIDGKSAISLFFNEEPSNFELLSNGILLSDKVKSLKKSEREFLVIIDWDSLDVDIELWCVDNPFLLDFEIKVYDEDYICDIVKSYLAFRIISKVDTDILINGEVVYHKLIAHQGLYKDGLYRPSSSSEYLRDLISIKKAGFNGIRMYQKIENPQLLFCADALGLYVWQDIPSAHIYASNTDRAMHILLDKIIDRDYNHPSIITWIIFNENSGLHFKATTKYFCSFLDYFYNYVKSLDPNRLIIENSGFYHWQGDILDIHNYSRDMDLLKDYYTKLSENSFREIKFLDKIFFKFLKNKFPAEFVSIPANCYKKPIVISEFGGFSFDNENKDDVDEFCELFEKNIELVSHFKRISGFCYVQFVDSCGLSNGLFSMDRIPKVDLDFFSKNLDF